MPGNLYVLGGTKLFAAIGVTYPAGSTVTCTNGTSTLKAKTTTGQWVFAIPKPGTWTVTSTDGTSSKSQSVEISARGQNERLTLSYELLLFDGGALVGWSPMVKNSQNDSCSIGSSIICSRKQGVSLSYTGALAYTSEAVSLENYKSLKVRFRSVSGLSAHIGLHSMNNSALSDRDVYTNWAASRECSVAEFGGGGTAELDISACSGSELCVVLGLSAVKNETGSACEVDRVWLE